MRTLSIALVLSSFLSVGLADGLLLDGLTARSAGRGGANIAWADNGSILHDNAAGMINLPGRSWIEGDLNVLVSDVTYRDPGGESDYRQDPIPMGNFSMIKKLNQDVAVGLGIFSAGGFGGKHVMAGQPPFQGDRTYKAFGSIARILPGISLRLTDRWTVGATTGVAVDHTELEGPYTLQSGLLRGVPTLMDVQGTGAAFTWSIGTQYQLTPRTSLGLNYQSESRFELDGKLTTIIPGFGESAFDSMMEITWPRSIGGGIRHAFSPCKTVGIDLVYINWQRSFEDVTLNMSNATNPGIAAFGPLVEKMPVNWRDSLSVRLGYEEQLTSGDQVRLGYTYHRNPIPSGTITPYVSPSLEHTFALGYGSSFAGWNVDVAYQFMYGDNVDVTQSRFIGGDFDNSSIHTTAHFVFFSLSRNQS